MKFLQRYILTSKLSATSAFDGGFLNIAGGYFLKFIRLIVFIFIWKNLLADGEPISSMSLNQILTYTFMSSILSEQLNIVTPASTAFWEGSIASRYTKPMPVLSLLIAETIGRWLPSLFIYSIPMLILSPIIGINLKPESVITGILFVPSFLMAISLGFALDFLYSSIVIYIKNAGWTAYVIRQAFIDLFSGALIPFDLFPWGLGNIFKLLPLGSVAGAPLSIYTGSGNAWKLLALQLIWNVTIWSITLIAFKKSEERMVSYGG